MILCNFFIFEIISEILISILNIVNKISLIVLQYDVYFILKINTVINFQHIKLINNLIEI